MPINKLDGFVFDRGIDRIIRNDQHEARLPDAAPLPPTEGMASGELDRLLALPNLEDYLAADLQPAVADKTMLTPQGFQLALQAAIATLDERAADPAQEPSPAIAKARLLLGKEAELRDLVFACRHALHQG
jgi:Type III secretion system YscX (type_III_YscX)